MYKHLLLPTDGSELSHRAVAHGLGLAKRLGARATVLTVTEPMPIVGGMETAIAFPEESYRKSAAELSAQILDRAREEAASVGVPCETVHIANRVPAEAILEAADTHGCDAIVMATHGRHGLSRFILGSQASKVVSHSRIPVIVCPPVERG